MVPQLKKILFATDLTEDSRYAFRYASSLANRFEASVVLLHVIEKLPAGVQQRLDFLAGSGAAERFCRAGEQNAREVLIGKKEDFHAVSKALGAFYHDDPAERPFHEVCEIEVVEGRPPEEIVRATEQDGCDLVILGAHKGWHRGASIGGVAKHVLHRCKVPVMIVPREKQP